MQEFDKIDIAFKDGCHALGEVVYYFQQLEDELRRVVAFMIDPCRQKNHDSELHHNLLHFRYNERSQTQ